MRAILGSMVMLAMVTAASAEAQEGTPLPPSVAEPYVAYRTALESGDYPAAADAAETAWRAGSDAGLDPATLSVLASQYGQLANALGHYGEAEEAWRFAAERVNEADALSYAWGWHNVAINAYAGGDLRTARRVSQRALDAVAENEAALAEDPRAVGEVAFFRARLEADSGRLTSAGEPARQAIEAFTRDPAQPDAIVGAAYFLAGMTAVMRERWRDAAFYHHMARDIFARSEASEENLVAAQAISSYALLLGRSGTEYFLNERLAADEMHGRVGEADEGLTGLDAIDREGFVDAEPVDREAPNYPYMLRDAGVEGVAIVRFDIDAEGRTQNAEVLADIPSGAFERSVLRAVENWQYEPARQDGAAVEREGTMVHFHFKLR